MVVRLSTEDRFRSKIVYGKSDECWSWEGSVSSGGYGFFWLNGRNTYAHRFAYTLSGRDLTPGMVLDHLCHTNECAGGACSHRRCVNPAHLEQVSYQLNLRRSVHTQASKNADKTECSQGHEYTSTTTYIDPNGDRNCRVCRTEAVRRQRERELTEKTSK